MQSVDFYKEFTTYVKSNKNIEANAVLMKELGRIMTNKREDFIYVLRYSGINVPDNISDVELINLFIKNIHTNKKLMMGVSFLISHNNKMIGFDGEEYTSNICADAVHKSLSKFFDVKSNPVYSKFEGEEEMSNFEGDYDNLFYSHNGDSFEFKSNKPPRKIDTEQTLLQQQMDAKKSLVEGVYEVRKKEADSLAYKERKENAQKIVIGSLVGATILGVAIYTLMQLKKAQ